MKNCNICKVSPAASVARGKCNPCNTEYVRQHRLKRKTLLHELRSVPCADCKQTYPPVCMDFDHMPGFTKSFTIMSEYRYRSWKLILEEVAKCEVVCANCHRIRTEVRR